MGLLVTVLILPEPMGKSLEQITGRRLRSPVTPA